MKKAVQQRLVSTPQSSTGAGTVCIRSLNITFLLTLKEAYPGFPLFAVLELSLARTQPSRPIQLANRTNHCSIMVLNHMLLLVFN